MHCRVEHRQHISGYTETKLFLGEYEAATTRLSKVEGRWVGVCFNGAGDLVFTMTFCKPGHVRAHDALVKAAYGYIYKSKAARAQRKRKPEEVSE